jgi:hypothetical protein
LEIWSQNFSVEEKTIKKIKRCWIFFSPRRFFFFEFFFFGFFPGGKFWSRTCVSSKWYDENRRIFFDGLYREEWLG